MRINPMTGEPASTAAGGFALYKLGWWIVLAFLLVGAVLAAVVVMAMTVPKTVREFVVALVSTLMFSFGLGAVVVRWFELTAWASDDIGLVAMMGVAFVCGLPGWVVVRGWFAYSEARKGKSLLEIIGEVKAVVWK